MALNSSRKETMDMNGNTGYNNDTHDGQRFIPKYVDKNSRQNGIIRENTNLTQEVTHIKPTCFGIRWGKRWNPIFFNCWAYFGAALCFVLTMNIKALPDLWYPTIGNLLLPWDIQHENPQRVQALLVLWGVHFLRRFSEVLFVHIYARGFKLHEAIGVIIYYCFFGLWIGWSVNIHIGYRTPPNALYVPGILICFIGGCGNFMCHLYLREMSLKRYRPSYYTSQSHHVLPERCCFKYVACPHYLFEVITWIGFSMTAFTMASWTFTLVSFTVIIMYSYKRHRAYQREFGTDYDTKKRKALVPFIF